MIRDDVCYLVAETPSTHGVFDKPSTTERTVFCAVRSVYSSEFWRAHEQGLEPQIVFVLSDFREYEGECLIRYESDGTSATSRYYSVIRTYVNDGNAIEITCAETPAYAADGYPANEGDDNNADIGDQNGTE